MNMKLANRVYNEAYRCPTCSKPRKTENPIGKIQREVIYDCGAKLVIFKEKISYQYKFLTCQKKLR